jgi:hypothetical protein
MNSKAQTKTGNRQILKRARALRAGALTVAILLIASWSAASAPSRGDRMERAAGKISRVLKRRHLPYGTVFDPVFASTTSNRIVDYQHAGDAAIWTGHLIAADSFRYAATGSRKARTSVRRALAAVQTLVHVTGNDVLARAAVPVGARWERALLVNLNPNHIFRSTLNGTDHYWAGNTSRDQYSGIFFGLGFAWEFFSDDPEIRARIIDIVDRLLGYLINNAWTPQMPDGTLSTTFVGRPDQQLAFLQIGRMVNPERFSRPYQEVRAVFGKFVKIPIDLEATDPHGSYFKFNLDHINLVHLLRLEEDSEYLPTYRAAFNKLRETVVTHDNPHFNMIARVVDGPNKARDKSIKPLLNAWLDRPRRIGYADLSGSHAVCGDRACDVIPVVERVPTDFLWQRSPFLLSGGEGGDIEGAGIDYLLPYWMARYYGIL